MRLNQNLDKSKKYFQLSFNCKVRISKEAIEQLKKPSNDISRETLTELKELGAIVGYKSADDPNEPTIITLTPFGVLLAESAGKYKV